MEHAYVANGNRTTARKGHRGNVTTRAYPSASRVSIRPSGSAGAHDAIADPDGAPVPCTPFAARRGQGGVPLRAGFEHRLALQADPHEGRPGEVEVVFRDVEEVFATDREDHRGHERARRVEVGRAPERAGPGDLGP